MAGPLVTARFLRGFRDGLPFLLVIVPFALLFGIVATEAGLNLAQVMGFSVLVVAGASQFAALQLMIDNAPAVIVLSTALVVNLRMAMYSAALAPYLGAAPLWQRALIAYLNVDQTYALSQADYEAAPERPLSQKIAYFLDTAAPVCPAWYGFTYVGAVAGGVIPPEYALDFAVPITFLALIAPALKTLAHVAAALTSVALALAFSTLPSGLGLILAAAAAMAVGAQVELWLGRRAA